MDDIYQHRVGLLPRKADEVRTYTIVFTVSVGMFAAAFIQAYFMRRREKKKQNGLINMSLDVNE